MLAFEAGAGPAVGLSALDILFWGVLPYAMVVVLVGGLIWRYKYDQFGWTTRSSQLYESRLLRIASPLFHFGLLAVIAGHFFGLVIPMAWTQAAGMSQEFYHVNALAVGGIAGVRRGCVAVFGVPDAASGTERAVVLAAAPGAAPCSAPSAGAGLPAGPVMGPPPGRGRPRCPRRGRRRGPGGRSARFRAARWPRRSPSPAR